jgi:hypothetical protein
VKRIPLTGGGCAIVDDQDFAALASRPWRLVKKQRRDGTIEFSVGRVSGLSMHQAIVGKPPAGMVIDHRNGNRLDNRRCNLRFATTRQNQWNKRKTTWPKVTSRFKGVYRKGHCWIASIKVNGSVLYIGGFDTEIAAAAAYDEVARLKFGEFACVNFPRPGERGAVSLAEHAFRIDSILGPSDVRAP